jgi:hypothetical protein
MAEAARSDPPILVRSDTVIADVLNNPRNPQYPLEKFQIKFEIKYNFEVMANFDINLFMYNINSKSRNDCVDLEDNYHSKYSKKDVFKGRGIGCSYIGFFDKDIKNLVSDYYNKFFNTDTPAWFLNYNIIDPYINVENITSDNYAKPQIDKIKDRQVKKILYAESENTTIVKSRYFNNIIKKIVESPYLPGEYIVIGNLPDPIFTLNNISIDTNKYLFKNAIRKDNISENTIKQIIQKLLILSLLNKKIDEIQYKSYSVHGENIIFTINIKSIQYIFPNGEINLTCDEDPQTCINEILKILKDNSIANYILTHLKTESDLTDDQIRMLETISSDETSRESFHNLFPKRPSLLNTEAPHESSLLPPLSSSSLLPPLSSSSLLPPRPSQNNGNGGPNPKSLKLMGGSKKKKTTHKRKNKKVTQNKKRKLTRKVRK